MKKALFVFILFASQGLYGQSQSLLPEATMEALIQEASGGSARRNLQSITEFNRVRGSKEFHSAAEFIVARAREAGLSDARMERFPADGKTAYGTLKARHAWDAESAQLWEVQPMPTRRSPGSDVLRFEMKPVRRICSWEEMRVCLAEDSESADVTAELVDVGRGTTEKDYEGRDVKGKIILISSQGSAAQKLGVDRFGAAGMVSYALNQPQGWNGEDDSLVRWGHLDSYSPTRTFAFMISLKQAREFKERLAGGEKIWLHAKVQAGRHDGFYEVVTGTLPGRDDSLKTEEIVYGCHLDHQMPGANDNASGCVTLLEVARTLHQLIAGRRIAPPKRTLRFVWPPEIEGTMIFLNSHPELVPRMKAAIHMDMVGGSQVKTKAIFHVTRTPDSIPSFVNDVAQVFGEYVRDRSAQFAASGDKRFAVHSNEGSKDALHLVVSDFTEGSDHQIYDEGSFRIPSIYLNDWPDRYIHTDQDSIDKIDPSKLKQAAIIGAASGYFLANLNSTNSTEITSEVLAHAKQRMASSHRRFGEQARLGARLNPKTTIEETEIFLAHLVRRERETLLSLAPFIGKEQLSRLDVTSISKDLAVWAGIEKEDTDQFVSHEESKSDEEAIPLRKGPKGPVSVFGFDYLADRFGAEKVAQLKVFSEWGEGADAPLPLRRGGSGEYTYEILNLVDGKRSVREIRDAVSAEFGPIPQEWVTEYLQALASVGMVEFKKP